MLIVKSAIFRKNFTVYVTTNFHYRTLLKEGVSLILEIAGAAILDTFLAKNIAVRNSKLVGGTDIRH